MRAILGYGKWKWKPSPRKENCLEAIGERLKNAEDKKWEQNIGDTVASLYLVVADDILSSISELQLAKEIWDTLTNLYKSLHNNLKKKNSTLWMSKSTSVTEYINTLETLFSTISYEGSNESKQNRLRSHGKKKVKCYHCGK